MMTSNPIPLQNETKHSSLWSLRWPEQPTDDLFDGDLSFLNRVETTSNNDCRGNSGYEALIGFDSEHELLRPTSPSFPEELINDCSETIAREGNSKNYSHDGKRKIRTVSTSSSACRRKKKPRGMPKRPLSAYNLYFQAQRANLLDKAKTEEKPTKLGFEGLGKAIGKKWRELSEKDCEKYEKLAELDGIRYRREMKEYNEKKSKQMDKEEEEKFYSSLYSDSALCRVRLNETPPGGGDNRPVEAFSECAPSVNRALQDDSRGHAPRFPTHNVFSSMRAPYHVPPDTQLSVPPPPPVPEASPNERRALTMPPGMEIILSDRSGSDHKYRLEYKCYSMTREEANRYIQSIGGGGPSSGAPSITNADLI